MSASAEIDRIETLADEVRAARLPSPATCRRIREEHGVTLRDVAAAVGVEPLTVLRWEHSRSKPRREHARRWRALLEALEALE
jgi:DNA-binding transcriptional regulator YiaG